MSQEQNAPQGGQGGARVVTGSAKKIAYISLGNKDLVKIEHRVVLDVAGIAVHVVLKTGYEIIRDNIVEELEEKISEELKRLVEYYDMVARRIEELKAKGYTIDAESSLVEVEV